MMRFAFRFIATAAATAALGAFAQGYPARPITMVVPFSAGGPTDTIARIMAERMGRTLNQTIVVENVAGAGGTIANNKVMKAPADGYMVAIGHVGTHVIAPAVQQLTVDYVNDFEPISLVASNPQVMLSKNAVPARDLKERLASAPDIPTVDEAGMPGFYMSIWHAYWVPKGTPRDVVAKLNAAIREALADPVVRKRLEDLGQEIPPPDQQTPEALRAHHRAETDKWWPVIKAAGIKAQ